MLPDSLLFTQSFSEFLTIFSSWLSFICLLHCDQKTSFFQSRSVPIVTPHYTRSLFSNFLASVSLLFPRGFSTPVEEKKKIKGQRFNIFPPCHVVLRSSPSFCCADALIFCILVHRISAVLTKEWSAFAVWKESLLITGSLTLCCLICEVKSMLLT